MPIAAGGPAPDVKFMTADRQEIVLSSFKGQQNVVRVLPPCFHRRLRAGAAEVPEHDL